MNGAIALMSAGWAGWSVMDGSDMDIPGCIGVGEGRARGVRIWFIPFWSAPWVTASRYGCGWLFHQSRGPPPGGAALKKAGVVAVASAGPIPASPVVAPPAPAAPVAPAVAAPAPPAALAPPAAPSSQAMVSVPPGTRRARAAALRRAALWPPDRSRRALASPRGRS